jgi:hypothetical protein
MFNKIRILILVLIISSQACLKADLVEATSPNKESIFVDSLFRKRHEPDDIKYWFDEKKRKLNLSDELLINDFVSRINRYDIEDSSVSFEELRRIEIESVRAARFALLFFPANPKIENSILDAYRRSSSKESMIRSAWVSVIADYGSMQATNIMESMLSDPKEKNNFIRVASNRPKLRQQSDESIHKDSSIEMRNPKKRLSFIDYLWCILILIGLIIVARGVIIKSRAVMWMGLLIILSGLVLMIKFNFFGATKNIALRDSVNYIPKGIDNPPARLEADNRSEKLVIPYDQAHASDLTPYENLQEQISELMAPFQVADPHDQQANLKDREVAANKLLTLLKSGMPEGSKEDKWLMIVQQIMSVQSCSPASMDGAIKLIETWISDPARTEQETFAALTAMMQWQQSSPFKSATPEYHRFERIADMQIVLFEKASPALRGHLLWNLGQAEKIISEPKSQVPRKLISDQRLLELAGSLRQGAVAGVSVDGQALMVISNRIKDQPDSFPVFESALRQILSGKGADVMGRMSALEMLTARAKKVGNLPEWSSDAEIVRQLAKMRVDAVPRGADRQPTGKEPDFIDSQALGVIRNRVSVVPVNSGKVYGKMLVDIAGSSVNDSFSRLSALDLAVKAGALTVEEISNRFAEDPVLGEEIQKRYAK